MIEDNVIPDTQMKDMQNNQDAQLISEASQIAEQNPLQTEGMPHVAGLSAWGARAILKAVKPIEKTTRKKIHIIERPKLKLPTIEEQQIKKASEVVDKIPGVENSEEVFKKATDITGADLKQFKTTDNYQINFDTIEGGDDVTTTIAQMAEHNKNEIDEARRGVITDEQLNGLANDLGQDPNFIKSVLAREGGDATNAETVLASRQVLEQSAVKLKELSGLVKDGRTIPDDEALNTIDKVNMAFSKQWQFHRQFMNQFMGMRAEFGRGLRAFGANMESMEQNKIHEVMSMVANDMNINKIADQISTIDTASGINKLVQAQDSIGRKGTKVFVENFISSILSGVKTQIVNTSGTALRIGMDIPDTLVASIVGKAMPDGQERVLANEALAKMFGMVNGFQDALQTSWKVMKTAEPYGGIDKLDMMHQKAISSEYLGLQKDSMTGKIVDTYGQIVRAPLERLMGPTDAFFKVIAERMQLSGLAYRKAAQSGLEGEYATKYLQNLMENPTEDMINQMNDYALDVTFQTPLGEGIAQNIQTTANKHPSLKMFMPFVKTPVNLMKQAYLERTPLGLFSEQYKADIAAGGSRAQLARAKMINGTMLATSALMWAMNGRITGSDPKDPKLRQLRQEAGWRPRSFVFENEDGTKDYLSYDRAEPFSYLLGTVADIVEYQDMVRYDDPDVDADKQMEDAATGLVSAFATNTLDKSYMAGLETIMNVMTDSKRYGKQYLANMANSVLPYSGLRRDIAKINDDLVKESFDMVEKLKRNTPGFNDELPNRLDNYGEPIHYDAVLNPWAKVTETKDKVKLEILRLAKETHSVAITSPSKRIEGIKLTSQQYHDYVKYSRKDLYINGMNFHDTLLDVMNSDFYLDAPTEDARVMILNTIKKKFDEAGKAAFLNSEGDLFNEELLGKIMEKKKIKAQKLTGENYGL